MYCVHCGKKIKNKTVDKCPHCDTPVIKKQFNYDQTREFNRALHNRLTKSRETVDNAMVFVVLGTTLLLIGILFFVLSYKYPTVRALEKELSTTCFEFWVSAFGLVVGGFLLITGIIRALIQKLFVQREVKPLLEAVQNNRYSQIDNEEK